MQFVASEESEIIIQFYPVRFHFHGLTLDCGVEGFPTTGNEFDILHLEELKKLIQARINELKEETPNELPKSEPATAV